jgi:hypothetical protein
MDLDEFLHEMKSSPTIVLVSRCHYQMNTGANFKPYEGASMVVRTILDDLRALRSERSLQSNS